MLHTREHQALLSNLINAPVGIFRTDEKGLCIFVNKRWTMYTGMPAHQAAGRGWTRALHPEDRSRVIHEWHEAVQKSHGFRSEYRFKTPNGKIRWIRTETTILTSSKGAISGHLGFLIDITEQKEKEQDITKHDTQLQLITNSLPVLLAYIDKNERYQYINTRYEEWFNLPLSQITGKTVRQILGVRAHKEIKPYIKEVLNGRQTAYEKELVYKTGIHRWVRATYMPHTTNQHEAVGFFSLVEDITHEQHIRESLEFLSTAGQALSSSLDLTATLQKISSLAVPAIADWIIVDLIADSGKVERIAVIHRDPKQKARTVRLRKNYPPDMGVAKGVPNVIRTGKPIFSPVVTEKNLHEASQNRSHFLLLKQLQFTSCVCVPLINHGKVTGVLSLIYGPSKRVYTRADLLLAEELAGRVALALENARLYQRAQQAVQARDEFLSIASHELKTPLTSIQAFIQILQRRCKHDPLSAPLLNRTATQVHRLTSLVGDLLDITRIHAGKLAFHKKQHAVDTIIAESVHDFRIMHPGRTITVKGDSGGLIRCDKERLGQVISNLLSNALKYSPKSSPVFINIRGDRREIEVQIQDFGIGIPAHLQGRIFERFFRGHDSQEGTLSNLGLGLYISAEIIHRHHGVIGVKSTEGKGSIFYFRIPRQTHHEPKIQKG